MEGAIPGRLQSKHLGILIEILREGKVSSFFCILLPYGGSGVFNYRGNDG